MFPYRPLPLLLFYFCRFSFLTLTIFHVLLLPNAALWCRALVSLFGQRQGSQPWPRRTLAAGSFGILQATVITSAVMRLADHREGHPSEGPLQEKRKKKRANKHNMGLIIRDFRIRDPKSGRLGGWAGVCKDILRLTRRVRLDYQLSRYAATSEFSGQSRPLLNFVDGL